jgi:hypothetical protein
MSSPIPIVNGVDPARTSETPEVSYSRTTTGHPDLVLGSQLNPIRSITDTSITYVSGSSIKKE